MKFLAWCKSNLLWLIPLLVAIIFFFVARAAESWAAIAFAIFIVIGLFAAVLGGLVKLWLYLTKRQLIWWKSVLLAIGLLVASYFLLVLFIRLGN